MSGFELVPAKRTQGMVSIAIFGASGSGKTLSGILVARGIQSVVGGKIAVIDTENGRALDYAEDFEFHHMRFDPPFSSLRYAEALEAAVAQGASIVMIDSTSHEHEGEGGMIDYHEAELRRMAGDDWRKREAVKMLAWSAPKAARKVFRAAVARLPAHLILCFRAKEGAKPVKDASGKTQVVQMGFTPIAGDEFVYEMKASCLLYPNSQGRPTWKSDLPGESQMIKLPRQFRGILDDGKQLSEEHGRALAEWARGGDGSAGTQKGVGTGGVRSSTQQPRAGSPIDDAGEVSTGSRTAGPRTEGSSRESAPHQPAAGSDAREEDELTKAVRGALRQLGAKSHADALKILTDSGVVQSPVALVAGRLDLSPMTAPECVAVVEWANKKMKGE